MRFRDEPGPSRLAVLETARTSGGPLPFPPHLWSLSCYPHSRQVCQALPDGQCWSGVSACTAAPDVAEAFCGSYLASVLASVNEGFPGGSVAKESACNAGDLGLIPGSGRSPGEGNSNPLQYSCLESPMGRGAWRATVHGVASVRYD